MSRPKSLDERPSALAPVEPPDLRRVAHSLYDELLDLADGVSNTIAGVEGDGLGNIRMVESGFRRLKTFKTHAYGVLSENATALGVELSELPWRSEAD